MDLLGDDPQLSLNDEDWRIFARHGAQPPQYIGRDAVVENSSLTAGCEIYGTVKNCVLGAGVKVMEGATVCDSVIMDRVVIEAGAQVTYSIIDSNSAVGKNCKVGADRKIAKGIAVIGEDICVPDGTTVLDGAMISKASDLNKEDK